jgi:hypothetical protein
MRVLERLMVSDWDMFFAAKRWNRYKINAETLNELQHLCCLTLIVLFF